MLANVVHELGEVLPFDQGENVSERMKRDHCSVPVAATSAICTQGMTVPFGCG
jgi:hypothetical protein